MVQIWESRELLDAFNQAVFIPALACLGERAFPRPPQVMDFAIDPVSNGPNPPGPSGADAAARCSGRRPATARSEADGPPTVKDLYERWNDLYG